jgi:fermentation-respiration switch protein FrsA (DUF1100 family)
LSETVVRTADGETLVAWVAPPAAGRPVLLFFHGNAGNLGVPGRVAKFKDVVEDGTGLFALSYRGYGGSTGTPSEEGLARDAAAAYDAAVQRFGADRLVAYGESLGGAVAIRLATEARLMAVILEAPFVSAVAVAQHHYPFVPAALLLKDQYRSQDIVARVGVPLLVMHGERDGIVPFAQGVALYNAANPPRRFVRFPQGGHEDLMDHGAIPQIRAFLADVEKGNLPDAQVRSVAPAKP